MTWGAIGGAAVSVVGGALLNSGKGGGGGDNLQGQIAADQWNRYKTMYSPLEERYIADAQNYDSAENYAKAAGQAQADVSSSFGKARDQLTRTPGLDTSSPAYTAALAGLDQAEAANSAVGQNAARQKVKDTAWSRRSDALNLGKGLQAGAISAANSSSLVGQQQYLNNMNSAGALGRITDRVISSPGVQGWLGGSNAGGGSRGGYIDPNSVDLSMIG